MLFDPSWDMDQEAPDADPWLPAWSPEHTPHGDSSSVGWEGERPGQWTSVKRPLSLSPGCYAATPLSPDTPSESFLTHL